jgi:hypothetical protein
LDRKPRGANELRNLARGDGGHIPARTRIFALFRDEPALDVSGLSQFLKDKLFKLKDKWTNLPLSLVDRRIISALLKTPDKFESAYLKLATEYVLTNHSTVNKLLICRRNLEYALFSSKFENIDVILSQFSVNDRGSLLFIRTYSARYAVPRNS